MTPLQRRRHPGVTLSVENARNAAGGKFRQIAGITEGEDHGKGPRLCGHEAQNLREGHGHYRSRRARAGEVRGSGGADGQAGPRLQMGNLLISDYRRGDEGWTKNVFRRGQDAL